MSQESNPEKQESQEDIKRQYVAQINRMASSMKEWTQAHPDQKVEISFRLPPKVFVTAAISDAVDSGIVKTNDAGLEMLKASCSWGDRREATVFMVREALNMAYE